MKQEIELQLSRFQFKGAILTEREKEEITETTHNYFKFTTEGIPMTEEREGEVTKLLDNQIAWVKERLGVSVSERRPRHDKIRYHTARDYEKIFGDDSTGYHTQATNEIDVMEGKTENGYHFNAMIRSSTIKDRVTGMTTKAAVDFAHIVRKSLPHVNVDPLPVDDYLKDIVSTLKFLPKDWNV